MIDFFLSFFAHPSAIGIGLAIIFGAIWLAGYWPPLFKRGWLWAVMAASAIVTLLGISFIQIPLQSLLGQVIVGLVGLPAAMQWLMLAGLPGILVTGFVQEGTKLLPVFLYVKREGEPVSPQFGLVLGAVAGAGFGIFEAQWIHNVIIASGWTWQSVQTSGLIAMAGFWERYFAVGFHVASSALAGYGLARGKGWQFYVLASLLHAALNYMSLLLQANLLPAVGVEVLIAVIAILTAAAALLLRWRVPGRGSSV